MKQLRSLIPGFLYCFFITLLLVFCQTGACASPRLEKVQSKTWVLLYWSEHPDIQAISRLELHQDGLFWVEHISANPKQKSIHCKGTLPPKERMSFEKAVPQIPLWIKQDSTFEKNKISFTEPRFTLSLVTKTGIDRISLSQGQRQKRRGELALLLNQFDNLLFALLPPSSLSSQERNQSKQVVAKISMDCQQILK